VKRGGGTTHSLCALCLSPEEKGKGPEKRRKRGAGLIFYPTTLKRGKKEKRGRKGSNGDLGNPPCKKEKEEGEEK